MKKCIILLLTLCLVVCFAGCQGGSGTQNQETTPNSDATGSVTGQESSFVFNYKGLQIKLHANAAPILEALGEPVSYTESASCAFEGLDKTYYYGSFYLDTYPKGDEDFVYGWWFADDSVATEKGIYIGASQADVEKAYGTDGYNGSNAFVIRDGGGTLTVILEDGVVTSIQYAINLD